MDGCERGMVESAWLRSVEEMRSSSAVQLGVSACGPTALLNILEACGYSPCPSAEEVLEAAPARLRDHSTPSLISYLTSRAKAGTIHDDLIQGAERLTGGRVSGVFFAVDQFASPEALSGWLRRWVSLGAAPLVTLNLFLQGHDAYHHQTVFGVEPGGIWTSNPVMKYSPGHLLSLLTAGRHMVIPRSHILARLQAACATGTIRDLLEETELLDATPPWSDLAVGTQVRRILTGVADSSESGGKLLPLNGGGAPEKPAVFRDLVIPWGGLPGVTIFALHGTPAMAELQAASERCPNIPVHLPLYPLSSDAAEGPARVVPVALRDTRGGGSGDGSPPGEASGEPSCSAGPSAAAAATAGGREPSSPLGRRRHHHHQRQRMPDEASGSARLREELATVAREMAELAAEYEVQAAAALRAAGLEAELLEARRELERERQAAGRSRVELVAEIARLHRALDARRPT